ncbi:hypothetical protein J437_LFUL008058 [Ladona fulva]|uniref:serine--tRNA ligase n=1 Tax=Ladona fulva TaxID=123851 RepID=A0A8K0K408_LADFU|nr:hypothetical protein J437_LFUL008058 [Ladona fulva]
MPASVRSWFPHPWREWRILDVWCFPSVIFKVFNANDANGQVTSKWREYELIVYVRSVFVAKSSSIAPDKIYDKSVLKPFPGFERKLHELDLNYLCNKNNIAEIEENVKRRKLNGDIKLIHELFARIQSAENGGEKDLLIEQLSEEALKIPNKLKPGLGDEPELMRYVGEKKTFSFSPKTFENLTKINGILRTEKLGHLTGRRSYFLCGALSQLEEAIVNFTVNHLYERGFQLVSVPDILPASVIEGCGMTTRGERNQVYRLDNQLYKTGTEWGDEICLSGTSEMALAALLAHESCSNGPIPSGELPLRICAVSRCYRAEVSSVATERGLYRVHEFTKVEMFGACPPDESAQLANELVSIEEEILTALGLHARVLQMGAADLGPQAYYKVDIEAWMPGRATSGSKEKEEEFGWGEVSSCSDCTDFQSRRLGIHYADRNGNRHLLHTVNGTAAAIPRLLIAILETHQREDKTIEIPNALRPFMNGCDTISPSQKVIDIKPLPVSLRSRS